MQTDSRIIFLDIDGVILSGVDWLRPENRAAAHLLESARDRLSVYREHVKFNASAMTLVNALCTAAPAQLVLMSSWRRTHRPADVRDLLTGHGIEGRLWHVDFACPVVGGKRSDVKAWLGAHDDVSHWVALDDEAGVEGLPDIGIDGGDGFTSSPFRVAARVLGADATPVLGCHLEQEHIEQLAESGISETDIGLARWLEFDRGDGSERPPSRLLRDSSYSRTSGGSLRTQFDRRFRDYLDSRALNDFA
ncbi:hypothetical protein FHR90_003345 [Endobacter medicaginis]|uniref:Uncharacterized protein n=1 Tax=Endobacter medicaginis TaxID=1181271 RepID=A0A850NNR4_9PROT|nr:HAD domain-containing protein [Endobacter medicaginis]MBB3175489.1 hypothetical protein [Endobacter medicaginis]MCX5476720.1 HAD domain-containing protein [Endobacter medicaginis]NVN30029.1 hypothetical protein [Endobacter medicaginis]